jgi:hypothetical protein
MKFSALKVSNFTEIGGSSKRLEEAVAGPCSSSVQTTFQLEY